MMLRKLRAQSTLEYAVLLMIVMGALLATSNYVKRGIQGRWKSSTDDMGDQYDPRVSNSYINHAIQVNSDTRVQTINANGGFWTTRTDAGNTYETRRGNVAVGAY